MTFHHSQQRRKSWLPPSNLLTAMFYPRQQKRRSQSLDQGSLDRRKTNHKPALLALFSKSKKQPPPDDPPEEQGVSLFELREDDVDRMQQKNDLIRLAFAGEFTRPKQTIDKVLDIGCGPLSWSIDFAKTHPKAQVVGMDYVNMLPPNTDLPTNCQLLIHNCLKTFPYDDATVDLCHVRFMNVSLTMDQYTKMVAHCWRVLKPGGYLELMEMDMLVYSPGPVTELLNQQVMDLVRTLGLKPRLARLLKDVLPTDAGLTDDHITEVYRSLPIGNWGGRLGYLFRDDLLYALTHARPTTDQQNDLFETRLVAAEKELEQYKSYSNFHFLRVQKPPPSS